MEISIVKIKNVVSALLDWVRADLITNVSTPTLSWLYNEFNGVVLDDTNFYEQLKSLLENGDDDRRQLLVRLMFDKERANLPTIHIHYPAEEGKTGDNTLNTGFIDIEYISGTNIPVYSRSFKGTYELVVTGGNSLEVVMLYEFLDAILIAAADTLAYNFDRFEFSGKQLLPNQDIIPYLTYYRAIGLEIQAKKKVRAILGTTQATDIQFVGTLYADGQQPDATLVSVEIRADVEEGVEGDTITFVAAGSNAGSLPVYTWYVDDVEVVGELSATVSLTFSTTGTYVVRCELFSSVMYLIPRPALSNDITIVISAT